MARATAPRLTLRRDPSSPLLERVRVRFVLLNVVAGVLGAAGVTRFELPSTAAAVAYVGASLGLAAWAAWMWRTQGRYPVADLVPPVLLATIAVAGGHVLFALGYTYSALFLHGLYGDERRRVRNAILYVATYVGAQIATTGVASFTAVGVIADLTGLAVTAWLMGTLADAVRKHDAALRTETVLTRSSSQLLVAQDRDAVVRATIRGITDLVGDAEPYRITMWRHRGDQLEMLALAGADLERSIVPFAVVPPALREEYAAGRPFRLDREQMHDLQASMDVAIDFDHGVTVPTGAPGEGSGLLFVATARALEDELVAVLERFVHEVALADGLVRRNSLLSAIVTNSADSILLVDRGGTIVFASPATESLCGVPAADLADQPIARVLLRAADGRLEPVTSLAEAAAVADRLLVAAAGGEVRQVELSTSEVDADHVVLNLRDVTERRELEDELTHRASHDPVTGLGNRRLFTERLRPALERAARGGTGVAVALVDLDDFKAVNDRHGHRLGDRVLIESADRLRRSLRHGDTASRFGGDEFAILLEGLDGEEAAVAALRRVIQELRAPMVADGVTVAITTSVGLRYYDAREGAVSGDDLVGDADIAMYVAKGAGKDRVVPFRAGMRMDADDRAEVRQHLPRAVADGELRVHYQPVLALGSGRTVGFEALVRWQHPERGLLHPGAFVPAAEELRLIDLVGRFVLERACLDLASWRRDGADERLNVAVNVSAQQLLGDGLLEDVEAALRTSGLPADRLVIEITETALMDDRHRAAQVLVDLAGLGVGIAIDDFGTGYSSLAYLQRFPVRTIKIDRSFIAGATEAPEGAALTEAIVKLARAVRVTTVAEGVETEQQLELLRRWGCDYGQGWLWSPALEPASVPAWLARTSSRVA